MYFDLSKEFPGVGIDIRVFRDLGNGTVKLEKEIFARYGTRPIFRTRRGSDDVWDRVRCVPFLTLVGAIVGNRLPLPCKGFELSSRFCCRHSAI